MKDKVLSLYYLAEVREIDIEGIKVKKILSKPGGIFIGTGATEEKAWESAHETLIKHDAYELGACCMLQNPHDPRQCLITPI